MPPVIGLSWPPIVAGAIALASVNSTLESLALQDGLHRAISIRRGSCSWNVDHAGWVVTRDSPRETCYGQTLEDALAWCLVWLMAQGTPGDWGHGTGHPQGLDWGHEIGVGPFRV